MLRTILFIIWRGLAIALVLMLALALGACASFIGL